MAHSDRIRQDVLRRVAYARNTNALMDGAGPPEGLFDTALTNGLVAIVADEFPGLEFNSPGRTRLRSARELLQVIEEHGHVASVDVAVLHEGLELTQPGRHGRADDEFAVLTWRHFHALVQMDKPPALKFLDTALGRSQDECVVLAYRERVDEELPAGKERLLVPEPDVCEACGRETFLRSGWDEFGGDNAPGGCIACAYERTAKAAREAAVDQAIERQLARSD